MRARIAAALTLAPLLAAACLTIALAPGAASAAGCASASGALHTFRYVGDRSQSIAVPAGVLKARLTVVGGHGGEQGTTAPGGRGGLVEATVVVTPGDCLTVFVPGYGAADRWGFATGGDRGTQDGPGRNGAPGGGAAAVQVNGRTVAIAGGGGGGGGDGSVYFNGGAGGDGAGGAGPGTATGAQGGNGQGVPAANYLDLGGLGGEESGGSGGGGYDGTADLFSGAGGGGGGGKNGGEGGSNWAGFGTSNVTKPVGGGGGGGGDSWATPTASEASFAVDASVCPGDGDPGHCQGQVTVEWIERPAKVTAYGGDAQAMPITAGFPRPLQALVQAESGDPVPGVPVTFVLPVGGAGADFAVPGAPTSATAVTNQQGLATSPTMVAGRVAGSWSASAAAPGVDQPARFSLQSSPAATATALYSSVRPSASGEQVRFTAVVGATPSTADPPQGTVSFDVGDTALGAPVALDPGGVAVSAPIALPAGGHTVTAGFDGTTSYRQSGATLTQEVDKGQVVVALASAANPSHDGDAVEFTAHVAAAAPAIGAPEGTVQFSVGGTDSGPPAPLAAGAASRSIALPDGSHVVRAAYSGDGHFATGDGAIVQSVGAEATATTLSGSAPAPAYGQPLTITATVAGTVPPSGHVTFTAGPVGGGEQTTLCAGVTLVAEVAECTPAPPLGAGRYELGAAFAPDQPGMEPSSGRLFQLVARAPTGTQLLATPDPLVFGRAFAMHADVAPQAAGAGAPSGAVEFSLDGKAAGRPAALEPTGADLTSAETPTPPAGARAMRASYPGDADFAPSETASVLSVDPAETVTSVTGSEARAPLGRHLTFTATVGRVDPGSGAVEGQVQFSVDGRPRGAPVPISGGDAAIAVDDLDGGVHEVRASFAGGGDFAPSEGAFEQTVVARAPARHGILPCGRRQVALAAVYRQRGSLRFEGAAVDRLVGARVNVFPLGHRHALPVSSATVRPDGTFWAAAPRPAMRHWRHLRYVARVEGHRSEPRRLGRAVALVGRAPRSARRGGKTTTLRFRVDGEAGRLALARQGGCRRSSAKPIRSLHRDRHGVVAVAVRRPAAGRPFSVYRLIGGGGKAYSTPVLVRAAR